MNIFSEIKSKINCADVLRRFNVAYDGNAIKCPLPGHDDSSPSFSLYESDSRFKCFGCGKGGDSIELYESLSGKSQAETIAEMKAIAGIADAVPEQKSKPVISKIYGYPNADGSPCFEVVRYEPKDFRQRKNQNEWSMKNVQKVLYNLPEVLKAKKDCRLIFYVEGEKDSDTLTAMGFTSTTNAGGGILSVDSKQWLPEYAETLTGCNVAIIADKDKHGRTAAECVAINLQGKAGTIRIVECPDVNGHHVKDVTDFFNAGGTVEELKELVRTAAVWQKKPTVTSELAAIKPDDIKKPEVILPGSGKLVSEFAKECFSIIAMTKDVFNYSDSMCRVATTQKKDAKTEKMRDVVVFKHITNSGFVTEVEKHLTPIILVKDKETDSWDKVPKSIGEQLARIVCECSERERLPAINLISSVALPYFDGDEICLSDPGYDSKQELWTDPNCPKIETIPLSDAVAVVRELLSEFCFLEPEIDFSRAIAYLLTPMLKLINGDCRAQIFYVSGNRPGLGKDLLLGLNPVLYTGREPYFSAPCGDDDEYRKLIFASCIEGAEFLLISNVSGHLKSDPIEQGATSIHLQGRVLGKSENKRLLNNAIWGISGNGLSLSEDMVRRCFEIRLEAYAEDITQQQFKHSDLYGYAIENREKILSALLTLIVNWKAKGAPLGTSIRSFVKWSQVTSGILTAAGLPCPFIQRHKITPSMTLGGNRDTSNLKNLVEAWYANHGINNVKAEDLRKLCDEFSLFQWLEMETRGGIIKFTKMLTRFGEREFSGLKIHIEDNAKYKTYYLEKVMS